MEQALAVLGDIGGPVVVKPLSGHHGEKVAIELSDPAQVAAAFHEAASVGEEVLIEAYIPGRDHRVLVVGDRVVAAAELTAAQVTGDGRSTIAELVASANADPARGEGHDRPLTRLTLGDTELGHLAAAGPARRLPCPPAARSSRCAATRTCPPAARAGTSPIACTPTSRGCAAAWPRRSAWTSCGIDLRLPDIGAPLPPDADRRRG